MLPMCQCLSSLNYHRNPIAKIREVQSLPHSTTFSKSPLEEEAKQAVWGLILTERWNCVPVRLFHPAQLSSRFHCMQVCVRERGPLSVSFCYGHQHYFFLSTCSLACNVQEGWGGCGRLAGAGTLSSTGALLRECWGQLSGLRVSWAANWNQSRCLLYFHAWGLCSYMAKDLRDLDRGLMLKTTNDGKMINQALHLANMFLPLFSAHKSISLLKKSCTELTKSYLNNINFLVPDTQRIVWYLQTTGKQERSNSDLMISRWTGFSYRH